MPQLTVNGVTFNYPSEGQEAGTWGADATDWASEVTDVLGTVAPEGTITITESPFNDAASGNVAGLQFSSSVTQVAKIIYKIKRNTLYESGTLDVLYDNGVWKMSRIIDVSSSTDLGVSLNIDDTTGQVTYTSTSTGVAGTIKFKSISTLA